eukprot:6626921-Alexandrium_andersonii.AAC.1
MSASLVGSEMCIRDRDSLGADEGRALRAARGPAQPSDEEQRRHECARFPCLLYTSDAADDM